MQSAGEKQHHALVLIETLFQHLPHHYMVGLLYDVGCQLHKSCVNWGFLSAYLHHLIFAISVFHAFGHQWPCQIIYHPQKCNGFGLSNGEGCECFWNSIKKLIAYLCVCGVSLSSSGTIYQLIGISYSHINVYTLWIDRFNKQIRKALVAWLSGCFANLAIAKKRNTLLKWHSQNVAFPKTFSKTNGLHRYMLRQSPFHICLILNSNFKH